MRTGIVAIPKLALLLIGVTLSGCSTLDHLFCAPNCQSQSRNASSLVDFLYPDGSAPPMDNAIPQLPVPLRVGLAFLPPTAAAAQALDAASREQLLERIRARFKDRKFVSDIVIIPDYYLSDHRGFAGLDGVQRLYKIDLMALVSYDQITHEDDNNWSLGYLTIVGAYVLKGTRHDVSTLVDLAVVDPATHSLVLRAGGTDTRAGNSTLVDASRQSRAAAVEGFSAATQQMIEHFDGALAQFEQDVHSGKANVKVVSRNSAASGTGGGGAFDDKLLVLLLALFFLRVQRRSGAKRLSGG